MKSICQRFTGSFGLLAATALVANPFAVQDVSAQQQATVVPNAPALEWDPNDPRIGLGAGWLDAESAISGLELLAAIPRPDGFFNPTTPADGRFNNTDLAFSGDLLVQGNYNGFQLFNISEPANPTLDLSVVCPGGQGDVSAYGDLIVMSAQETRGRLDCGIEGVTDSISAERMRGVRIFDVSDMSNPTQVAAIQSCRGSHTHTIVTDPTDSENIYIYIQGTSRVRPGDELAGCSGGEPEEDANTALFRIEVVKVPLANPAAAEIVNMPRIFANDDGNIGGLWQGGDHGEGTQSSRRTNQCHDITAFPDIGLAGGACSGNGILLDISDPENPMRIGEVVDPNFAYWHSATFNNDGSVVIFTDEWGGGSAPRCRATDPATWGANAIFRIGEGGDMELAGYYKLPVPQTDTENCVAHNGSIIPVPGRDIMAQAWYQGGVSLMDFTDPENAFEIAFFDRGPLSIESLFTGGYWSTYWYNGRLYGAEISRGIDVFRLAPSEHLSAAEIAAAESVMMGQFNAQLQPQVEWAPTKDVAQAYLDQMVRGNRILNDRAQEIQRTVNSGSAAQLNALAANLEADAVQIESGTLGGDAVRMSKLAAVLRGMAM
ncbi:MAG: LVIVD repeat-containing protein [Longimicrobiales bacterium]